jgi:hypothetical protein
MGSAVSIQNNRGVHFAQIRKGHIRRLAYPALQVPLKTYRKIRGKLIGNTGRKGTGGLKLPPKHGWLNLCRISRLVNFSGKVKDAFTLEAAPHF